MRMALFSQSVFLRQHTYMGAEETRKDRRVRETEISAYLFHTTICGSYGEFQLERKKFIDDIFGGVPRLPLHDDTQILARDIHAIGIITRLMLLTIIAL